MAFLIRTLIAAVVGAHFFIPDADAYTCIVKRECSDALKLRDREAPIRVYTCAPKCRSGNAIFGKERANSNR